MIFVLLVAGAYALATLRRYSVAQTATLTTFALFLSSGLTTVSSAPIEDRHHHNMQVESWTSACYSQADHQPIRSHQKLSARRALKKIRRQFDVAQNQLNSEYPAVKDIYENETKQLETQLRKDLLPDKQYEWYQTSVSSLNTTGQLALILPKLHDELQKFHIAFYSLNNTPTERHVNPNLLGRRSRFLVKMDDQVNGLLCEVETELEAWNMTTPHVYELPDLSTKKKLDYTGIQVQDSLVLRPYEKFIKEWKHALGCAVNHKRRNCNPAKYTSLDPNVRHKKKNHGKMKKNVGKKNVKAWKGQGTQISVSRKKAPKAAGRRKAKVIRRKLTGNKQRKTH